jgi:hypothetical protein
MATPAMPPTPDQGGSPAGGPPPPSPQGGPQGGQQGPPSQQPANQIQSLLGQWSQVAQQIASAYPQIAAELNAIVQKIGEAQTKLISPPQPTPMTQQPMYS